MDLTAYRAGTGGGSSGWGVADAAGCHYLVATPRTLVATPSAPRWCRDRRTQCRDRSWSVPVRSSSAPEQGMRRPIVLPQWPRRPTPRRVELKLRPAQSGLHSTPCLGHDRAGMGQSPRRGSTNTLVWVEVPLAKSAKASPNPASPTVDECNGSSRIRPSAIIPMAKLNSSWV